MAQVEDRPDPFAGSLVEALMRLQELHSDMTVLQARAFFAVAATPGLTQRRLLEIMGSSDSAVSRAMAVLSEYPAKPGRMGGLGLVKFDVNIHDRREKFMRLTPKGERLWRAIANDTAGKGRK
jgi:DNA-binding MarR family transcriptional regulator